MEWFYLAADKTKEGPFSATQLGELLRSGTISRDTLIWREGLPDWQPLRTTLLGGNTSQTACAECGEKFPRTNMVLLNQSWVCAACKPTFIQRLAEGAPLKAGGPGAIWRSQRKIILRRETPLPDRCIRCNAGTGGFRLKRQLSWHPSWYYATALLGVVVYVIVALFVRKKAVVHVGLCDAHRNERTRAIRGSLLTALAGIILFFVGMDNALIAILGFAMLTCGIIFCAIKSRLISPAKIDDEFVWLNGFSGAFLAGLPEWNGPQ